MTTHLIWFHGWGLDHTCFLPLIDQLPMYQHHFKDQGYFSTPQYPQVPEYGTWIGIGHSLGFAHLLEDFSPFAGYISLCGFYQFCADPHFASGISARVIKRMIVQFQKSPAQVLQNFYQQCGFTHSVPKKFDATRLEEDLRYLLTVNVPLPHIKLIGALAGEDDLITPLAMQEHLFKNLIILEKSGHLPWLKDVHSCAQYIQTLIENHHNNDQTTNSSEFLKTSKTIRQPC